MKTKLDIQWFIEQHSDWEQKLQEKPYCITISRDVMFGKHLIMFKYSQIDSDFSINLVRECRGLILDEDTLAPVCIPFFKFGNYGESYCPQIDWKSCWVGQKLDGSLIKIVKMGSNDLLVSTNGTIDAFKAPLAEQIGCTAKTFGDLVNEGLAFYGLNPEMLATILDYNKTYLFELTSPFNKVVVTWHETKLNFLGVRDNLTFKETYFTDHHLADVFNTPKVYPLRSIDECITAAAELDVNEEGYVICDKNFNRVKVKSPTYISLHHIRNNGVLSFTRGVEIVRGNELAEVLTYFPEFAEHLNKIKEDFETFVKEIHDAQSSLDAWIRENGYDDRHWLIESGGQNRKDAAIWIMSNIKKFSGFAFGYVDAKFTSADEYLKSLTSDKIAIALGYKD